jgi:hypothetical protein
MGKGSYYYTAPQGARKSPSRCMGHCGRPIVYGDRCPDCARELRKRTSRKPR